MENSKIESVRDTEEGNFRRSLELLIKAHSRENVSHTPDFILAEYLDYCLRAFDNAISQRETWYGR